MNNQNNTPSKRHMGLRLTNRISNTAIYIILVIMSVVWLVPFICIVLQSFRIESTWQVGYVIPQKWGWDNYIALWNSDFKRWYLNTFITALCTAALQTVIVLCMSYTLSRFRFKLRSGLMRFMLILGMFPGMLTMIILYRVLADMGLTQQNAVPGLILVYVASSGMGYYVSKGFFDTISKSIDEAAMIDGANRAQIFWDIILPLAKPIVVYTILTSFMAPWGDYITSSYIIGLQNTENWTVAIGLYKWATDVINYRNSYYTRYAAGSVIVAIPMATLFIATQKYYVSGVTGGAVKG
jgi:arabinogalactan oligomer/maltooligosaccharide transport system permease protein